MEEDKLPYKASVELQGHRDMSINTHRRGLILTKQGKEKLDKETARLQEIFRKGTLVWTRLEKYVDEKLMAHYFNITRAIEEERLPEDKQALAVYESLSLDIIDEIQKKINNARNKNGKRLDLESINNISKYYFRRLSLKTIKKIFEGQESDLKSIWRLFLAFELELDEKDYTEPSTSRKLNCQTSSEVPDISEFYGRLKELEILEFWLTKENVRLVSLEGIGGIGKTALAAKLLNCVKKKFDYIIWKDLKNAPIANFLASEIIQTLSNQKDQVDSETVNFPTEKLIKYFEKKRCLLVLDNFETVLQAKELLGYKYRDEYENYGKILELFGKYKSKSCLVITTRETPKEIRQARTVEKGPVRSLILKGVDEETGKQILDQKGLKTTDNNLRKLLKLYDGNPFVLQLSAELIKELFLGNVSHFLEEGKGSRTTNGIIEEQFNRRSYEEVSVMFWLAINRKAMSLREIREIRYLTLNEDLQEILSSLVRSFLVELTDKGFALRSQVLEYTTGRFLQEISKEIYTQEINFLNSHCLLSVSQDEYIQESQIRFILYPILNKFNQAKSLKLKLSNLLELLRRQSNLEFIYAIGNILNLALFAGEDLGDFDFSNFPVREAYLKDFSLHGTNFKNAQFENVVFSQAFGAAFSLAFSPESKLLAIGGISLHYKGLLSLFNVESQQIDKVFEGRNSWVRTVAFIPNDETLICGSEDGKIHLWNLDQDHSWRTFYSQKSSIWSIAISPNREMIAGGDKDGRIHLFDLDNNKKVETMAVGNSTIWSIDISANGKYIACASEDGSVAVWNIENYRNPSQLLTRTYDLRIFVVAFSPDNKMLAIGREDGNIHLLKIKRDGSIDTKNPIILECCKNWIWSIAFEPNGKRLAGGDENGNIYIWDIYNEQCLKVLKGHNKRIWDLEFSPDQKLLASCSDDYTVGLWKLDNLEKLHTFKSSQVGVMSIAISPDGRNLTSGGTDGILRFWDIESQREFQELKGHQNRIWSVSFNLSHNLLASSGEDGVVRIWDSKCHTQISEVGNTEGPFWSIAFSPDGNLLAGGGVLKSVFLWDVTEPRGPRLSKCLDDHHNWIWAVVFHPKDPILASSAADGKINIWDLERGQYKTIFQQQDMVIRSIAFSPDGEMLVSGSDDGYIRLWDTKSYQLLEKFQCSISRIWSVAFSPDGTKLAVGDEDGRIYYQDLNSFGMTNFSMTEENSGPIFEVKFCSIRNQLVSCGGDGMIRFWDLQSYTPLKELRSLRPYEGMNITGVKGLSEAQKQSLIMLGAVDEHSCHHLS
jgi:WD40 repeat protein